MKNIQGWLSGALVLAAVLSCHPAGAQLIGLSSGSKSNPSALWSISESNGFASEITPINEEGSFVGLGYLGVTLYASDIFYFKDLGLPEPPGRFVSINTTLGAVKTINYQGGSMNWLSLAPNNVGHFFYVLNFHDDGVEDLDAVSPSGTITYVATINEHNIDAIAFDSTTNTLFGLGSNSILYSVDSTNGALAEIGDTGIENSATRDDLAFDPSDNQLYMINAQSDTSLSILYTVNTTNGLTTVIGSTDHYLIDGLAAWMPGVVPEPSTWAMTLLGFAGLGCAGYRRAKASRATLAA